MKQKNKWYDKSSFKTRQGELILPNDFSAFKYSLKHEWVIGLKPKLYFKKDNIVNHSDGEIIYSFFAKQFGIRVVEARPAILLNSDSTAQKGVVTENFIENSRTQQYITAEELKSEVNANKLGRRFYVNYDYPGNNTVQQCMEKLKYIYLCIKNIKEEKPIVLDPNIKQDMIKMVLLDYIFLNEDRHANNFVFVIEEKSKCYSVSLGKIFDNSLILSLSKAFRQKMQINPEKTLKHASKVIKLRMSIRTGFSYGLKINEAAADLAEYIVSDKEMFELYKKIEMFNFDAMESIVQKTIPNYKISPAAKELIKIIVPHTKKVLSRNINKIMKNNPVTKSIIEKSNEL